MPKLDDTTAQAVEEAESSGGLMDEGIYEMYLLEVQDTKDGKPLAGDNGPYWIWVLKVPEDAERYKNWQQWMNTSLSEKSAWKLKENFGAFGVSPDTDTDELIGKRVRVEVGVRTIQKGARAGEPTNFVKKLYPLDPSDADDTVSAKPSKASGGKARY